MHPLQIKISSLSDSELDEKIKELSKKYFVALKVCPTTADQIIMLLDDYKFEYQTRLENRASREKSLGNDLDDLINVG